MIEELDKELDEAVADLKDGNPDVIEELDKELDEALQE